MNFPCCVVFLGNLLLSDKEKSDLSIKSGLIRSLICMQNRSDTSTIRKELYENVFKCFIILRDFSRVKFKHLKTFEYNFSNCSSILPILR